jgi:hypothetical protein
VSDAQRRTRSILAGLAANPALPPEALLRMAPEIRATGRARRTMGGWLPFPIVRQCAACWTGSVSDRGRVTSTQA